MHRVDPSNLFKISFPLIETRSREFVAGRKRTDDAASFFWRAASLLIRGIETIRRHIALEFRGFFSFFFFKLCEHGSARVNEKDLSLETDRGKEGEEGNGWKEPGVIS